MRQDRQVALSSCQDKILKNGTAEVTPPTPCPNDQSTASVCSGPFRAP